MENTKTLQATTLLSMIERLSPEVRFEVVSALLSEMTLEEVLNHPVLMKGYKQRVLETHKNRFDSWDFMLSHTKDVKLLRQMFERDLVLQYDPFRHVTRCYRKDDGTLVLISDWAEVRTGGFNLQGAQIKRFNFRNDIVDFEMDVDKVFILREHHHVPNPDWFPGSILHDQTIAVGQTEVPWWTDCLDSY